MNATRLALALLMVAAVAVAGAGCGSGGGIVIQKAGAYIGGALTNFAGVDGSDADARSTAREIAINRTYDFTPAGFVIASGNAASKPGQAGTFGDGTGTLAYSAADSTVELDIASNDAQYANVTMTGEFNGAAAQQAIDSPGASFTVTWTISWEDTGEAYTLIAEQSLSGTDWT